MSRTQRSHAPLVQRRCRIAYISHTAAPSGAELSLLEALSELDVDRQVILGADGPLHERLRQVANVSVHPMPGSSRELDAGDTPGSFVRALPGGAAYVQTLARELRRLQVDIVHTNSLKSALYGAAAAKLARKPCVVHVRDRIASDYLDPAAATAMRNWIQRSASVAIANSRATQATLSEKTTSVVIPSPIAAASSRPSSREHRAGPVTFGTASRLSPWKGQLEFIRAFHAAFPAGEHRACILGDALFGEDVYVRELHEEVRRLGLEGRVLFLGHRDDVAAELARIDVLVHTPTIPEPFGRVVVEGMAAGCAVIARGDGGPAEIISSDADGLLFPPNDHEGLVAAMRRLTDAGERQRLADAALMAVDKYTPQAVARQIEQVYAGLR